MSKKQNTNKLTFIILSAGGASKGLPKSLINIDDFKLIDYQTSLIKKSYPSAEILLVCGFDSKRVVKYIHSSSVCSHIRVIDNTNFKTTSSLHSLKLAVNSMCESSIFVIHGDRILNNEAIQINDIDVPFVVIDRNNQNKECVGIAYQDDYLRNMSYGLKTKWAGLFYVPQSIFYPIRDCCNTLKSNSNIYELINMINESHQFRTYDNKNIKIREV